MARHASVVVFAFVLFSSSLAVAQAWPTYRPAASLVEQEDQPFVFAATHLGLGAPLGLFGLELGVGAKWFRGGVGVGIGLRGLELGLNTRAMAEFGPFDLGVGVGVSKGGGSHSVPLGWSDPDDPDYYAQFASNTLWMSGEVVLELALPLGAFTRLYAGASYAASIDCVADYTNGEDDMACSSWDRFTLEEDPWMPYVGVAGGFRFPAPPSNRGTWNFPTTTPMPVWPRPTY